MVIQYIRNVGRTLTRHRINLKNMPVITRSSRKVVGQKKSVLIPVANGTDALETTAIVKVLRMANLTVDIASVEDNVCVSLLPELLMISDLDIKDCRERYDAIVLPGGIEGCKRLRECSRLHELIIKNERKGCLIGAICAAPAMVLAYWGMLRTRATCNPAPKLRHVLENLMDVPDADVVVSDDGRQVTAKGAPCSISFAVQLVRQLVNDEVAFDMADKYLFSRSMFSDRTILWS